MRIQNNIMAMNTHRMYTVNNNNIQKSAEKLSSGYRINRAGDDAAGLAISEKMRSQIRGLGMASKNSQDAISLVQTAEGALQEVHSMLQRMNELSVQAATGTNQTFDRLQLAKEFDQLKREINDIAEQTTFNNMKILDGSLSSEGPVRSAQSSGLLMTNSKPSVEEGVSGGGSNPTNPASAVGASTSTAGVAEVLAATAGEFTIDFSTYTGLNGATGLTSGTIGGQTINNIQALPGSGTDSEKLAGTLDGATVVIDGVTYTGVATGDSVTFTAGADGDKALSDTLALDFTWATATPDGVAPDPAAVTNGKDVAPEVKASKEYAFDYSKLKAGDTFTVGSTTYTLTDGAAGAGELALGAGEAAFATNITALLTGEEATIAGGKLTITKTGAAADGDAVTTAIAHTPAADASTGTGTTGTVASDETSYLEIDRNKLRNGDVVEVTVGTTTYSATWTGDIDAFVTELAIPDATLKTNTLVIKNQELNQDAVTLNAVDKDSPDADPYGTMRIQVGALEYEQLNIEVKSMNTAGLNLDDHSLVDQDTAGAAITATRAAVNIVSEQRALLGAMQNRLEHKISNLDNTAENLQAAESRIRDVDIAKEMTTFTKNNILAQAATAMLAQANAAPQSVLSLLQ